MTEKKIGRIGLVVENQKPATEESVELIDTLTDMLTRARAGQLLGLAMVEIESDGEYTPLMAGDIGSIGEVYFALHKLAGTLWRANDDEEENPDD